MSEQQYLACQIEKESPDLRSVKGKLMDGSSFSIRVPYWDVVAVPDSPIKAGWLLVEVLGRDEKNGKSIVKLSAPDVKLGHNICVSNADLKPVTCIQQDTVKIYGEPLISDSDLPEDRLHDCCEIDESTDFPLGMGGSL